MPFFRRKSKKIFLDHDGLAEVMKLRSKVKIDKADKILYSAIPSPAVADEIRKNASRRAREAKKRGDRKDVINYLKIITSTQKRIVRRV